ncbi:DsbA family protein [Kordiimonas lipolytica]|uniref:DsbA family protein n=1 Tax=Kordiimonas lipolytica TaxID=1662421 RepID=A0ABV8UCE2_9PROT|nr:DsbA family protein [Kordiimonas lipolytica]
MKITPIAFALAATLPLAGLTDANAQDTAIDPAERAKIERVLEDYLMENPEIVVKAIRELQRRQTVAQMLPAVQMYRDFLENEEGAPVMGNPNGDVTIVEFFDYRCGFCRRHFPAVMKLVREDGNIRLVPRQYPILDRPGQTPVSFLAAKAALAAHKQGKFEEFHITMMGDSVQLTEDRIYQLAATVGLNVDQLKADMQDKLIEKNVKNSLAIGQDIGFDGTPGYIIGDDIIVGAEGYNRLVEAVSRAREEKAGTAGN